MEKNTNADEFNFLTQVDSLEKNNASFAAGEISSVVHAQWRQTHLRGALIDLGRMHGIEFRQPLGISARGEFHLAVIPKDASAIEGATGSFGDAFVALLNQHNPRTGALPTKHMSANNGWCMINHFDVERLVLQKSQKMIEENSSTVQDFLRDKEQTRTPRPL